MRLGQWDERFVVLKRLISKLLTGIEFQGNKGEIGLKGDKGFQGEKVSNAVSFVCASS